ncbi:hypothetical protein COO60DRAFT_1636458 [Scenedesmus sp. NREL 46B-D3]|nr:hypothetical protein COO60DRAFT_1636458 [Scenedesmus sp. NREL 46B-D3]
MERLQPALLLALLLAYERSKGPDSFWYPYIASLPNEPPCGWFTALQHQQQQQQQQPSGTTPVEVSAAASAVVTKCRAAAAMYGPALGGCVSADDVVWAYGQVVSRAFGSGRDVAFAPLIDMLNHQLASSQPQLLTVSGEAAAAAAAAAANPATAATAVTLEALLVKAAGAVSCDAGLLPPEAGAEAQQPALNLWCVCKAPRAASQQQQQQQQQLVLAAGEELYISYVTECDARAAYLNFGFVPPERAGQQQRMPDSPCQV